MHTSETILSHSVHPHVYGPNGPEFPTVSIVVPAYCESDNLDKLYQELVKALEPLAASWELIVVDDGSTDGTWDAISALSRKDARVKGLRFSRNFGHQCALFAGLSWARGQAVISMDADLQHPPEVLPQLVEEWYRGNKVVHTVRIDHRETSWFKKVTSRMFYRIFSGLSGVDLSASVADFRLLDRQVLDDILRFQETGLFLRGITHWVGYPSSQVQFQCRERFAGERRYTLLKSLDLAWTGLTSFSVVPLRMATILGLVTSALAFSGLAYAIGAKLLIDQVIPGWASVLGALFLLFGILFMILGILGEYVGRILIEVRNRPRFLISDRVGFHLPAEAAASYMSPTRVASERDGTV